MEKIEKLFNSCKGIILFYIIVALLSFMLTKTIKDINSSQAITVSEETYYA